MISNEHDGATLDNPSTVPVALAAAIIDALVPAANSEATKRVWNRLRNRIQAERAPVAPPLSAPAAASAFITLQDTMKGGKWIEVLPKAHIKLLYTDGEAESYMIRLEPGASAPEHEHPAVEECLVLEGTLWQGDVFLQAGDFHVARPGDKHGAMRTETGALVFIRYGKPLAQYLRL